MSIVKTVTTIKKDGSKVTTTRTVRKKKGPPAIGGEEYTDYRQGFHLLCVNIQTICANMDSTISAFLKYYPYGEGKEKLEAIRKVLMQTACFAGQSRDWVIAGCPKRESPVEEGIDF